MSESFEIKDCEIIAIATGERAQNLRELRDRLLTIEPGCIYYHIWCTTLRPRFDNPEYPNDFAAWAWYDLRDQRLAEMLGVLNPSDFKDMEDLRRELVEVVEERLDEEGFLPWAMAQKSFFFVRSKLVVFNTDIKIDSPERIAEHVAAMSNGSIFYHFIDARRRNPSSADDFSLWIRDAGESYAELADEISQIDPYFNTLEELRRQLLSIFSHYQEITS